MNELTEQEIVRREKAEKIREMGIDPFGHRFERNAYSKDLKMKNMQMCLMMTLKIWKILQQWQDVLCLLEKWEKHHFLQFKIN